jgi:hypothetical protein
MNKRKWLLGGALAVLLLGGGTFLYASTQYQPLLFVVGDQVVRTDDWQPLKAKLFNGITYTAADEVEKLEQRSKEELILAKAREAGITADEANIDQQIKQLGDTPEERAKKLKDMNMTEEDVRTNYRRSLTAFQLKTKMTQGITVSEQEISNYYEQNKEVFKASEYRTLHFLKASNADASFVSMMQNITPEAFPKIVEQYVKGETNGRLGAFHELVGIDHLLSHITSEKAAQAAFQAPAKKLVGPIQDGEWNYWFLVDEIRPEKQFTLQEVHQKIQTSLLQDKQLKSYRQWLESQKPSVGYYYAPENLTSSPLQAFFHDFSENIRLLFGY